MAKSGAMLGALWQFLIRFVTPVMVALVLLWQVGAFDTWLQGEPAPQQSEERVEPVEEAAGE